ncbi:hypothetical protein SCLCIDRAFT_1219244 [Scleroderma citrinum Foug A]|uniref:Uncharacterized protein n=1 Tax=Scleroderma citrinum Foug A TaxID=1036808 RepID=A0A0C3DNB6_9AGAM|nr:hypothetical protein SCLCIDRAFT_1219244 [Scleroderma citrinum Foug A]
MGQFTQSVQSPPVPPPGYTPQNKGQSPKASDSQKAKQSNGTSSAKSPSSSNAAKK